MTSTLGHPIPTKPALFTPGTAPVGVEVKFVTFAATRPMLKGGGRARSALVHTNGASGEGTVTSAWNWSHARPGQNTLPHYQVDRKHDGVWVRKMLATNLRAIGNSTVDEFEDQDKTTPDDDFDISWHSIVIETADLGFGAGKPGEACGFQEDQGEMIATILAFEAVTSGELPLEYPDRWYGDGCMSHTDPWGYPYTTLYPGKVCPGRQKKLEMRVWILPRAIEIHAAWTGAPVVIDPKPTPPIVVVPDQPNDDDNDIDPQEDDVTIRYHHSNGTVLEVTGNQLGWYPEGISADLATAGPIIDRNLSDYAAKFTAILGRGVSEDEIVHRLIQSKATTTCPPPMVFANGGLLFSWRKAGTNEAACGGDPSQPAAVSSDGQSIVGTY